MYLDAINQNKIQIITFTSKQLTKEYNTNLICVQLFIFYVAEIGCCSLQLLNSNLSSCKHMTDLVICFTLEKILEINCIN